MESGTVSGEYFVRHLIEVVSKCLSGFFDVGRREKEMKRSANKFEVLQLQAVH